MDTETLEWIERSLRDAEKRRCISKVLGVEKAGMVTKGDNYTSEICRLKMKVVLYSGEVVERSVIFKALPSTEMLRKHINEMQLFNTERRIYKEVLPMMEKIRREKETSDPFWGECYEMTNSMMLMEDLAVYGYRMGNRFKGLDLDHCKQVLKSLAKFHSLSAILRERGDLITNDYTTHIFLRHPEMMKTFYKACYEKLADRIEKQWKGEWLPFAEKIRAKSDTVLTDMLSTISLENSKFSILNHGDCWVNNMLFKYDEDDNPISVRIVDFQICYYNTLALDLQHFLSTSTSQEVSPRTDELLEFYSRWLAVYLERFGYSGEIPSLETIKAEYTRIAYYGFVIAAMFLPLLKMPSKEVPDFEKMLNDFENSDMKAVTSIDNESEEYERAIKTALLTAEKYGVL